MNTQYRTDSAIATQLQSLIPPESIVPFEHLDPSLAAKIKRASTGNPPECVVYPRTCSELSAILQIADAQQWRVLPCGNASKLDWGGFVTNPNLVVSTAALHQLIEHAVGDLTITVEAGMKFSTLQQILASANQFLALDPLYPEDATIGGIIATADTGSWRHRYGGVRDRLIGLTFARSDGKLAKAGGKVVKNVAGYDLMKLFTGSYGTLGILSQVTLRVYPRPEASNTVILTGDVDNLAEATRVLLASALTPTICDLNLNAEGVRLIVRFQSISASVQEQTQRLLEVGQALNLTAATFTGDDEVYLWQQLKQAMGNSEQNTPILCKIGIRPTESLKILKLLTSFSPSARPQATIHARLGLGLIQLESTSVEQLNLLRNHCHADGGFLTILSAPLEVKQSIDIWGYMGNAFKLMSAIKQQFDPKSLLSPQRFVGGI